MDFCRNPRDHTELQKENGLVFLNSFAGVLQDLCSNTMLIFQ
jgi:hypothetical protein